MRDLRIKLLLAFLVALALSILPMPEWLSSFRPSWILLLVLYIEYFIPWRLPILSLFLTGLILDVLLSTIIGEHAFALLLVTWIASTRSRRFQFFSMMQQILLVGLFCFMYQLLISFSNAILSFNYSLWMPLASALSSMLLWPWVRLLGESSLLVCLPSNSFLKSHTSRIL
ncbi:MAG: rod shape-determining protein MreD [Legionella sp.]|nr:MAG: rod shape-determining protein MreD [Legionella sp.]PJD99757.1 MAG: rod shape-determining protein MreD [Legionella sp.]